MNTNFKVIGLTRLGIKPKSVAPQADALTTILTLSLADFVVSILMLVDTVTPQLANELRSKKMLVTGISSIVVMNTLL